MQTDLGPTEYPSTHSLIYRCRNHDLFIVTGGVTATGFDYESSDNLISINASAPVKRA